MLMAMFRSLGLFVPYRRDHVQRLRFVAVRYACKHTLIWGFPETIVHVPPVPSA